MITPTQFYKAVADYSDCVEMELKSKRERAAQLSAHRAQLEAQIKKIEDELHPILDRIVFLQDESVKLQGVKA